ncbi:hypothetical protein [Vagococcus fluvialis]|uniref:hypothetical protein n=1 Tax=Vagococcus fluvialis TaxID=2738 RepID=UPI001D0B99CC|nr:hypothetical protein [Vagococcus fluvialis]UDM72410.1 hypothetical protein K5L00_06765 [Vagococcus fluvialis]UDM77275.1 hypothetical protein K5K98_02305 [Vagococcus fluvialis]UDM81545.1 hypothetical protein K5K96_09240 [Vagococcus fluvialis]
MEINKNREYFLVSRKWSKQTLMFWGSLTKDDEKRSFGGYTDDLRICERYSIIDIIEFNRGERYAAPFDIKDWHNKKLYDETYYISQEQMDKYFNKPALVVLF